MRRTDTTTEVCHDFYFDYVNAEYNVRTLLSVATLMLAPGYIILSFLAILSRRNKILKELASHGKTSTPKKTIEKKTLTSPSWCWISKRRFAHFYFVGIVSTLVVTTIYLHQEQILYQHVDRVLFDETFSSRTAAVVLLMIHVFRRAYECLYIQQYSNESSKMHIAGYALGVGYYLVLPLVFWDIDATNSELVVLDRNDYVHDESRSLEFESIMTIFVAVISVSNLWLQYEQYIHHEILADIRRISVIGNVKKFDNETSDVCKISPTKNQNYSLPPFRRWFRYVLSPHYLAEILLYLTFAILLEMAPSTVQNHNFICQHTGRNTHEQSFLLGKATYYVIVAKRYRHWMLLLWVTTNLTVSAMNNHDWYNSRFNENEPIRRSNTSTIGQQQAGNLHRRRAIFPKIL